MPDLRLEREAIALFEEALDLSPAERDAWLEGRAGARPDLLARVRAMFAADDEAFLQTGTAADAVEVDERVPERIGAYRLAERIGRGGMGSVYLGERASGDFAHRVAIKIVKPGLLSEALIERFQRERQLLANLIHPNIAQLYDGGEAEGGFPYFIMEYVDGLPLLHWVEEHGPSVAERRRLFGDICGAVAFAHRSLIVHRDLTPSNVLVTRAGVVKLIDFGIARFADESQAGRDAGPSIASLSLTPGYAAPERMTSGEVTTAADVYSLGKLLEKLFAPLASDRELKAIVRRATARDPADRYPTADALGADVAAWGSGLPVAAVAGGRRYVVGKFVRRHRAGVAAAGGALALLLLAFAFTLFANARAEAARRDAERRFEQTRSIAKTLLFDSFDEVSRVPGSTRARVHLARAGLDYLDALAADLSAPIDVRVEAARGYLRLAQVVGGGQSAQMGRLADANTLLAKSEAILAPMTKAHPDDLRVRVAMAALLVEQAGTNLYNNNDVEGARRQARQAQSLLRSAMPDREIAAIRAEAMRAEGDTHLWTDEYRRARDIQLATERFIAGLPPVLQASPQLVTVRAANFRLLGEAYHKLKEKDSARAALDRAVELNRVALRSAPTDPLLQRRLITSLRYRAVVHRTNERDQLARESIEEARRLARLWNERDPEDAGALQLLALVNEVHAQVLADLGQFEGSYRAGDEALAAHRQIVARAGDVPGALRSMAQSMRTHGGNHYNGGDYAGACRVWKEAIAIFDQLDRRGGLTESDRQNSAREVKDFHRRACFPPHAGLGEI